MNGFSERRLEKCWSYGGRLNRSSQMENTFALWRPQIGRSRKEEKSLQQIKALCFLENEIGLKSFCGSRRKVIAYGLSNVANR